MLQADTHRAEHTPLFSGTRTCACRHKRGVMQPPKKEDWLLCRQIFDKSHFGVNQVPSTTLWSSSMAHLPSLCVYASAMCDVVYAPALAALALRLPLLHLWHRGAN